MMTSRSHAPASLRTIATSRIVSHQHYLGKGSYQDMIPVYQLRALLRKIDSLKDTIHIISLAKEPNHEIALGTINRSIRESVIEIQRLTQQFPGQFSSSACAAVAELVNTDKINDTGYHFGRTAILVAGLVALRSELALHIEFSVRAMGLVERAFLHLQYSIVANEDIRNKWELAFESGEVTCEKLGAVHLLQHGLWAFKAHSEKERTDLVLGEGLQLTEEMKGAAAALVLTEWKAVHRVEDLPAKLEEARTQVRVYAGGSLAGFELEAMRYLIMVSKDRMAMPSTEYIDGIAYRHINIAVAPVIPSKEGRRSARSAGRYQGSK